MTYNYNLKKKTRLKRLMFILFSVLSLVFYNALESKAQSASGYVFIPTSGATLDPMAGATQILFSGNDDTPTAASSSIGFNFVFESTTYTTFWTSPDGWIQLGGASTSSQFSNSITSSTSIPKLFPYWDDLATGTTGNARYVLTGTPGSQILKVEWFVTVPRATGGPANSTFQCWLYEGTNAIEFRYGTMGTGTMTASVGIRGAVASPAAFHSITVSSNTSSTATANDANAGQPASGTMYTFNPPAPCVAPVAQPTALNLSSTGSSSISGTFTPASGSDSYFVVRYPAGSAVITDPVSGTAYTNGAALGAGTVVGIFSSPSFTAGGLSANTTYDFYIYSANAFCSGGPLYRTSVDEAPLSGSFTTQAFTSSTALGGLWNDAGTWASGIVPGVGEVVVIADGATVLLNATTPLLGSLTVGQGTSGVLLSNSGITLNVAGNILINSGARFFPHNSTPTGITINVGGDFTNNGTASLAASSSALVFNGSQVSGGSLAQTLGGSGVFIGDGTRGIIRSLTFATTGSSTISTTQPLVTGFMAHTAGSLNTNGQLSFDNTAQVYGQAINTQVQTVQVTTMGAGYTNAPVVFGSAVVLWTPGGAATINTRYFYNNEVYVCNATGTFDAVTPPSHTSGKVLNGTADLLWCGTLGTIGTPIPRTALSIGTQYFYGSNLYVALNTGTIDVNNPPVHTSGTVSSGTASLRYVGSPAQVSVNFNPSTSNVRSLTLVNAGSGYNQTAPNITFSLNGGTSTSNAVGAASIYQGILGNTAPLMQKSGIASITGGLNINNDANASITSGGHPQSSTGVGAITTTNGGVNYTIAPLIGFTGPTALNLVTANGSGFTTAPTITVSGGNLVSGTALTTTNFTITVNQGQLVSVYLSTIGTACYSTPPTLTVTGGGGSGATVAWPANCWPSATAVIGSNGQLANFTVTNPGFGYVAVPTLGIGATNGSANGGTFTTIATVPTARIALYNLTLNFFSPAPSAVVQADDVVIPANRKINNLSLAGNGKGLILSDDLTLYSTAPLTLTSSVNGNILDLGGKTLSFSWNGYAGQTGTFGASSTYVENGFYSIITRGGGSTGSTLNFPFDATFTWFSGGGTNITAGSTVTNVIASKDAAPTGTADVGVVAGTRSYRAQLGAGSYGTNPTVTLAFNAATGLISDNPGLFVAQATSPAGPWTVRSVSTGTGSLPATGSRTTATTAPGPIVPTGDDYYAFTTNFTPPPPLNYAVSRTTANVYQSIAPLAVGGDGTGTLSTASGDEGTQLGINIASLGFNYQGSPVSAFAVHANGYVVLNNGLYTYSSASSWDNTLGAQNLGFGGTPDLNKRNVLAPFYDDLNKASPVIYYKIAGGKVTIEWFNTTFFGLSGPQLYYQVVLDSADQSITFNYGDMQLYNGTQNVRYSYTCGISGAFVQPYPQPGQIMQQQFENTTNFTHENGLTANWGANGLAISPEPHSSIKFTPGTYVPVAAPSNTPPANDDLANAIELPSLQAFPTNIAWNYTENKSNLFTTRNATHSNDYPICAGPADAKDVWFYFFASDPNTTVRVYGSGGYIPRVQVLDSNGDTLACSVGTQGLITNAVLSGLVPNDLYYVRVSHDRTGVQAQATATVTNGVVTGLSWTNGTNYSVPATAFSGYSAHNQGPIITFTGGGGSGAAAGLTNPTTPSQVLANLALSNIAFVGGSGYTSAPTVNVESPDWGITGEFGIIVFAKASNDECATATTLTNLNNVTCVDGQNAKNNVVTSAASASAEPSCSGVADDDVWYKFVAIQPNTSITVTGKLTYDAVFQVWEGGPSGGNCGTKTSILCRNSTGQGGVETSIVPTTVGNTYYVRVYDAASGAGGTGSNFDICINSVLPSCLAAPAYPTDGGNACTGPVTLRWNRLSTATGYKVFLVSGLNPADTLIGTTSSSLDTSFTTSALSADSYTWKIVPFNGIGDATGCPEWTFTSVAPPSVSIVANPAGASFCNGQGSVELTASGATSYTWSPAAGLDVTTGNVVNASPAATTTYTVSGSTIPGCAATASQVVTIYPVPAAPTGVTGYSVALNGSIPPGEGLKATCASGIQSATVSVSMSNPSANEGTACPGTNQVGTFTLPALPAGATMVAATFAVNGVNMFPGSFGSEVRLNFSGAGISANSTCFQGATSTSTPNPFNYKVGNVSASDTTFLGSLLNAAGGVINIRYNESFDDDAGVIDATFPSTGTFTYYYNAPASSVVWYDAATGGNQVGTGSPFDPIGAGAADSSVAGTYSFYARCATANCESSSTQADLIVGAPLVVTTSVSPNDTVCENTLVTISTSVSGGGLPYTYLWSNGATTSSISVAVTASQTITVTVTDYSSNSVSASDDITVIAGPPVAVTASSTSSCSTSPTPSITLTATGADTYTWAPSAFLNGTTGSTVNAQNVNLTTTYTVTGTDTTTGCTGIASVTINSGSPVGVSATATPAQICEDGTTQLNAIASSVVGNILITEVTLFRGGTGASSPYPAFINGTAQDFVEISNVSSSPLDISGFGLFDYPSASTTAGHPYTFPSGTIIPASGVVVVHLGTGTDSPANRYYNTGGTNDSYFSGGLVGIVLKNGSTIVDAVGINSGYTFAAGTGVTASDFSTPAISPGGVSGPRRTASLDSNTGNDWTAASASNLQNIGTYNGGFNSPPTPGFAYSWSPSLYLDNPSIANPVASNVDSTITYTVTVQDTAGGCSNSAQVTVNITPLSPLTISPATSTICAGDSVTLTSSVSGGGQPYTYLWSNGATTANIKVAPGTTTNFALTVTDFCNNSVDTVATVTVNPVPNVSVTPPTGISCSTSPSTIELTASGNGDNYDWAPTTGLDASNGPVVNATVTTTTTYTVTATNITTGCFSKATATITAGAPVSATASASDTSLCEGESTQLNVVAILNSTSNYTVQSIAYSAPAPNSPTTVPAWTNTGADDGSFGPVTLPFNFNYFGNTYNQIYVGTNGYISFSDLSAVSASNLRVPQTFPSATAPNNMVALGMSDLDVLSPGNVQYWSSGSDFVIFFNQVQQFASANTISGYIILHSADNTIDILCSSSNVTGNHTLGIENSTGTVGIAPAGRNNTPWVVSTPEAYRFSPPVSTFSPIYSWSPAGNLDDATIANPVASNIAAGSNVYTVTVTDPDGGCSATASVTIQGITAPQPVITPGDTTLCNGQEIYLFASDAGVYSGGYPSGTIINWVNAGGPQPGDSVSSLNGAPYFIAEVDVNGCVRTSDTVTVITRSIIVSTDVASATCGNSNGQINVTVTTGVSPYRFIWTDGVTTLRDVTSAGNTDSLVGLTGGNYELTVIDNDGNVVSGQPSCNSGIIPITVLNQDGPLAFIAQSSNISCNGSTDGSALSDASGGVEPYSYEWSTAAVTPGVTGLSAGTYTVTITDANGCSSTADVTITEPDLIDISVTLTSSDCGDSTGTVTTSVTGGTPGYNYEFFDENLTSLGAPSTDPSFSGLAAGIYYVQVGDTNSCFNNIQFEITENCNAILNLTAFIEGYYLGGGLMQPVFFNIDGVTADSLTDTLLVSLYDPMSPASPVEQVYTIIQTNGTASMLFGPTISGGTYYIGVTQRNMIETWSKDPVTFAGVTSYDFTTGSTQAYDDGFTIPMVEVEPGVWAFYSGDIDQDGTVDGLDMNYIEIDANNFEFGYNATDVSGDGATDGLDMNYVEINSGLFLFEAHP